MSMDESPQATYSASSRLTVEPAFADAVAAAGIATLHDLLDFEGGERLDKATLPPWRERLRIEVPGIGTCYLKRYSSPPVTVQLRRVFSGQLGRSSARIEWDQIRRLQAAGVGCVRGVAFGEDLLGPFERRSALLTAELPGESLERYVLGCSDRAPRVWVEALAEFVSRFHRAGFVHRDLYLAHVFVEADEHLPVFRLIDLARVMTPRVRRRRWIVKDLAQLNFSTPPSVATKADRLRFLKTYWGVDRLGPSERRLAGQVARKTRRIAKHDAQLKRKARAKP